MIAEIARSVVTFVASMIIMTVICTLAWDAFLNQKVYNCTDGGALDYLVADGWVGANGTYPLVEVDRIVPDGVMNHPDTIKKGWSVARLWYVWDAFFITSLAVSFVLAWVAGVRGVR